MYSDSDNICRHLLYSRKPLKMDFLLNNVYTQYVYTISLVVELDKNNTNATYVTEGFKS